MHAKNGILVLDETLPNLILCASMTLEQNAVMDVSWDSVYFTQWVQAE